MTGLARTSSNLCISVMTPDTDTDTDPDTDTDTDTDPDTDETGGVTLVTGLLVAGRCPMRCARSSRPTGRRWHGVNIAELVPEVAPSMGRFLVGAVESTQDGRHKLIGHATLPRKTDVLLSSTTSSTSTVVRQVSYEPAAH